MGRDKPVSAEQDVLVDANIFYAIGQPSNPQYQRFRQTIQHAGVVCKLPPPQRVIGELGGAETDRVRTALDEGWAEIIDAPSPTDGDAVAASDTARRTIANERALSYSRTISRPGRGSRTPYERRDIRTRSRSTDWRTSSATISATRCD
jgi:hypothetical protein